MTTHRTLRFTLVALLVLCLIPVAAEGQQRKKKKKKKDETPVVVEVEVLPLFEKGAYEELIAAVDEARAGGAQVNRDAVYLEARSQQKRQATGAARRAYDDLAAGDDQDAWTHIGKSAAAVLAGDLEVATAAASRAVELDKANLYAHLQRGLVQVERDEHAVAADTFVRVLELKGDFAYAHYHAAMAYFETRNLVACANHLERFLQLAPDAPERLEVQSILATLKG